MFNRFFIAILLTTQLITPALAKTGTASWYGPGFHGKQTASGERFNQHSLTAAHKTLPFGTKLCVTNLDNNKTVQVVVNDRGPFVGNRILDLSKEAARQLGFMSQGVCKIQYKHC